MNEEKLTGAKQDKPCFKDGPQSRTNTCIVLLLIIAVVALLVGIFSAKADENQKPALANAVLGDVQKHSSSTQEKCDERLFLLYMLDDLYSSFPKGQEDRKVWQEHLASHRKRVQQFCEYVKERNFDEKLTELFADCLVYTDAHIDFLADSGKVERTAVNRLEQESTASGFKAGFAGGTTATTLYDQGCSGGEAVLGGLVAGVATWLYEDYQKSQARDEAQQEALAGAKLRLERKVSPLQARRSSYEADLAAKYGWKISEVGPLVSPEEKEQLRACTSTGDNAQILRILDRKLALRPNDLRLAAIRHGFVAKVDIKLTAENLAELARKCAELEAKVPENKLYDSYRELIVCLAADTAQQAWNKEFEGKAYGNGDSKLAGYAVSLWDKLLASAPDTDGKYREQRAWALMASGKVKEAVAQADEVCKLRGNTLSYAINYARLMNAAGDTAKAFKWFKYAVESLGFNNMALAKTDPDLAEMRKKHWHDFEALVSVKARWDVIFGIFNDDIILTNDSAFPITNVVLDYALEGNGQTWKGRRYADEIKPGETHTWPNAISVPGSRIERRNATLSCDQNK